MTADLADVLVSRARETAVVVELRGEHDLVTRDQVWSLLSRLVRENEIVVVDVSEAEFIDSSCLHNLFRAHELAEQLGTKLRLQLGTAPIVRRALEVSGALRTLEVAHDRERALRVQPATTEGTG
jgi:anti-anti-sigma factor